MKLIIVGAGEVGRELLKRLQKEWEIAVIDQDAEKLTRVVELLDSESLNRVILLQGDGTSKLMLKKAGIEQATAFAACTGDDEVNLEACRIAKEFNVPSIFAVSNSTENDPLYEQEGVNYVNKAAATASILERQIESGVVIPTNIGLGQGEIMEVAVMPTSIIAGYPVGKFSSKRWRIVAIFRGDKLILPRPRTVVKPGDRVLIVGDPKILKYIAGLIKSGEPQFPLQFGVEEVVFLPNYREEVVKDALFFFRNTKLQKVRLYTCNGGERAKEAFEQLKVSELKFKKLKLCEKEFFQEIKEESFGLITMPDKYRETPLFFGIKTLPILVAEETLSPVLIARGTTPVERILVPVSGSFSGLRALEVAIELSIMWQANITALFVTPSENDSRVQPLRERVAKISGLYRVSIEFKHRVGNPVNEFAKESKNYQLSVIGARKGRKTNWFNPYPPYHMVHRSKCSSLLICVGE
ncbi:NAD-binding protein [Thermovibrio ammonificans]|uniref:Trk system potassium uptake protein TrkA n=1 Tax=Thermovibrio ammonificans (strain DSM 15698 / JCM 12110 / HB-1) TaxID=648996 RepID=E8T578_THEA1|nr:NAD-binding protein [Thermovibrio ammonificans]ADU96416.1 TrkA-N domain protein [Thermovibrio ammonificans HB-1]